MKFTGVCFSVEQTLPIQGPCHLVPGRHGHCRGGTEAGHRQCARPLCVAATSALGRSAVGQIALDAGCFHHITHASSCFRRLEYLEERRLKDPRVAEHSQGHC